MSHRSTRPRVRGACAVLPVLFLALLSPACEDERGSITDPDQPSAGPDSDFIFGTTLFATSVFRFQNTAIDTLRRVVTSGQGLPVQFPSAGTTGFMRVNNAGTNLYRIDLVEYNDPVISPLFETINGVMIVLMEEADPALRYTINPGDDEFLNVGPGPHPVTFQLPTDFGDGASVIVSGTVHGELSENAVRHGGFVHETGTLRMEELTQRFLLVVRLGLEYEYDSHIVPSFDEWPVGVYEIGIFAAGTITPPFLINFLGDGRAFYPYRGSGCDVNLDVPPDHIEAGNPCSGL